MFIEQIRYYVSEGNREAFVDVRREISDLRSRHGIPPGDIMLADVEPEGGPTVVWQCGYESEEAMSALVTRLIGNDAYAAARERLASLMERAEMELYTLDDVTLVGGEAPEGDPET